MILIRIISYNVHNTLNCNKNKITIIFIKHTQKTKCHLLH